LECERVRRYRMGTNPQGAAMSWHQIARAYESGWTAPTRPKRPEKKPSEPRLVTVGGETKTITEWGRDPRNVHDLAPSTVWKRAEDESNLVSVEWFLRAPMTGRKKS
jgi:hypothetical protein